MSNIKLKVMFDRVRSYTGIVQFMMISWLFIIGTELNLMLTVLLVAVLSAALAIVDFKWIYPAEMDTISRKNPVVQEQLRLLYQIREKVGDKE